MDSKASRKIKYVAERMKMFFVGSGMKSASREMVEKWVHEIEEVLKEEGKS